MSSQLAKPAHRSVDIRNRGKQQYDNELSNSKKLKSILLEHKSLGTHPLEIVKIIKEALTAQESIDASTATSILKLYSITNNIADMLKFFEQIRSNKIPNSPMNVDVFHYATVISACSHDVGLQKSFEIFALMNIDKVQPNQHIYSALMKNCVRHGNGEKALELLGHMEDSEVRPDAAIYNCAMTACNMAKQSAKALELYKEMESLHLPRDSFTYGAALSACDKLGDWQTAQGLVAAINDKGGLSAQHMASAISSCANVDAWRQGLSWFNDWRQNVREGRLVPKLDLHKRSTSAPAAAAAVAADGVAVSGHSGSGSGSARSRTTTDEHRVISATLRCCAAAPDSDILATMGGAAMTELIAEVQEEVQAGRMHWSLSMRCCAITALLRCGEKQGASAVLQQGCDDGSLPRDLFIRPSSSSSSSPAAGKAGATARTAVSVTRLAPWPEVWQHVVNQAISSCARLGYSSNKVDSKSNSRTRTRRDLMIRVSDSQSGLAVAQHVLSVLHKTRAEDAAELWRRNKDLRASQPLGRQTHTRSVPGPAVTAASTASASASALEQNVDLATNYNIKITSNMKTINQKESKKPANDYHIVFVPGEWL